MTSKTKPSAAAMKAAQAMFMDTGHMNNQEVITRYAKFIQVAIDEAKAPLVQALKRIATEGDELDSHSEHYGFCHWCNTKSDNHWDDYCPANIARKALSENTV